MAPETIRRGRKRVPIPPLIRGPASQTTLELRARNLSANPSAAQFEYFFIAQNVNGGKKYIASRGNKDIALEAGADTKEIFESAEIVQSTTTTSNRVFVPSSPGGNTGTYQMRSTQSKTGSRPSGWVVRMFADGKLIRIQASSSELERMAYVPTFGQGPLN